MTERPVNLPALALVALSALSSCKDAPKPQDAKKGPSIEAMAQQDIRARLEEVARIDLSDGTDDFDENALRQKNNKFLQGLGGKDPALKRNFLLRLRAILSSRPQAKTPQDAQDDFGFMDLEKLYQWLQQRDAMVRADGTVHFPTPEAEARTTLADLTQDDEISFEATPETLKKMGIEAHGPFTATRLQDDMEVYVKGKKIKAKKGAFVVSVRFETTHIPYKIFVFNGDRIMDSLNKDPGDKPDQTAQNSKEAPQDFEKFLQIKMPTFSLQKARNLFHMHKPNYEKIFKEEYPELLTKNGMSFDKHFVYFVQWAQENRVPLNGESIRVFLDALSGRPGDQPESKTDKIVQQAEGSLRGEKDQDEHVLSYHDQRVKSESDIADILRKKHGPLFAIVRLQGSFFDNYTYNRLTGNYTAKVGATAVKGQEYLAMYDIAEGFDPQKTPKDIREKVRPASFVERLNSTTTYNASVDADLKTALAFSESTIGQASSPQDFDVQYAKDGTISAITLKGEPYNPPTFIAPPDSLKQIPGNKVSFALGGVQITMDLQAYFDRYNRLEAKNQGVSQQILLYDKDSKKVTRTRNASWFVESGDSLYQQIAEQITAGQNTTAGKIFAIGRWLQSNLNYIDEISEINKLTLATFMDHGGDCEDSYTAFKTLANAIELGEEVGGVMFDGHIATMIRGRHGDTTHTINGEIWTVFETATNGQTLAPGVTRHKNPINFILPDGQIVSASDNIVILSIVPLSEIDNGLVDSFNQATENSEKFITDPDKQPSEKTLDKNENILEEGNILLDAIIKAYQEIAATGKMADSIADKLNSTVKKYQEFLKQWDSFMSKQIADERKLELNNAPEKIKASAERFDKANTHFAQNAVKTSKKLIELLKAYRGKEKDKEATLATYNAMIGVINQSGVSKDVDHMNEEYAATLQHADPQIEDKAKKILQSRIDFINKYIFNILNAVAKILEMHGVE